nr:MAG TPA: hypothetical protein [Caudoviricetes sp.]
MFHVKHHIESDGWMINIEKLDMTIITSDTLMHIINDPYIRSVTPYADRKGLQCYSVVTAVGERYKVFTHGTVL